MKPPIILRDKQAGDSMVFETADDVLGYVESIDVENDVYEVFDSDGRLLEFEMLDDRGRTSGKRIRRNRPMMLRATETSPTHADEMKEHLIQTLVLSGELESRLRSLPKPDLMELARLVLRPR